MVIWWLCISNSGEARKFDLFSKIWPWRSRSIATQNNRDLDQGILYRLSKFVILAWMGDELWCGQAQNGVNFDFEVKFYLQGQGQLPLKTIWTLTKVLCIFGPNLVSLAWTGDELSRGQTWWRTDRWTDRRTQATTIPEGQNWPRVKTIQLQSMSHTWLVVLHPPARSVKQAVLKIHLWLLLLKWFNFNSSMDK